MVYTAANIAQVIGNGNGRGFSSKVIGRILTKLGFEMRRLNDGRFYKIFELPLSDVQSYIASQLYVQPIDKQ